MIVMVSSGPAIVMQAWGRVTRILEMQNEKDSRKEAEKRREITEKLLVVSKRKNAIGIRTNWRLG